jgi:hypothetical protein
MRLNLGCSDAHLDGWVNVDRCPPADQIADLEGPWPWPDSSVEEIRAIDVFEHIGDCDHMSIEWMCKRCAPWRCGVYVGKAFELPDPLPLPLRSFYGRIHVMNEAWRVLVAGGRLTMECPNASKGAGQWQDPTHVSPWCPNSLGYYEDGHINLGRLGAPSYGIVARFKVLSVTERCYQYIPQDREPVYKFSAVLEAVK